MERSSHELAADIILRTGLCSLATASKAGKPEVATMAYAADEELNLYFESFASYRKYRNLKENPLASVVITPMPHSVQMDGLVEELHDAEAEAAKALLKRSRPDNKYLDEPGVLFFKFTPTWIRLLRRDKHPSEFQVIKG